LRLRLGPRFFVVPAPLQKARKRSPRAHYPLRDLRLVALAASALALQAVQSHAAAAGRILLAPRGGTFYSEDVLNPDVVKRGNLYYLFFSGNQAPTDVGDWRTGVASSRNPLGGFRVLPQMQAEFLNGGTRVIGRAFVQFATPLDFSQPAFYKSRDLAHWRRGTQMPAGPAGSWNALQSDAFYDQSGCVYFAARPGPGGADIGVRRYLGRGRWGHAELIFQRGVPGTWDSLDLGEPAIFRYRNQRYMLYVGLGNYGGARQVGLARFTGLGWQRVGKRPVIAAGTAAWNAQNAIDPSPLVAGSKLYVYYAGGRRPSLGGNMRGTIGVRVFNLSALAAHAAHNRL
jgi:hypothetical protein